MPYLHSEAVVEEKLVIRFFYEVWTANCEYDLAVVVVGVDNVWRSAALGILVGDALDEPVRVEMVATGWGELGVADIKFVDGEDDTTDAWNMFEFFYGRGWKCDAVV